MLLTACGGAGAENPATDTDVTSTTAGSGTTAGEQDTLTTTTAGRGNTSSSGDTAEIPDDVPFPIPAGGSVFNYLDDPAEPVLTMEYEGDRSAEFVAFYEDWIAGESSASGSGTDTGVGTLFTVTIDGDFGGIINVSTAPTNDVTGIQLGWSRGGDAEQGDAAAGTGDGTSVDAGVMAAEDLPATPPAPFPAGGEINKFTELSPGTSLTVMYDGARRSEFVDFYQSWAKQVGAEVTETDDQPTQYSMKIRLDGEPSIINILGAATGGITMIQVVW